MSLSIRDKIAGQIAQIGPDVENRVIDTIIEKETAKRAAAIAVVLEKLEVEEKNLKKINHPDLKTFDRDKKVIAEGFSGARLQEIETVEKKIAKITNALTKALEKDDMQDVYQLAGGGTPKDKGGDQGTSSGGATE